MDPVIQRVVEELPGEIVEDAIRLHKHLAPGIILGFKMVQRALKEVQPGKEDVVILTSETTRCIPDGIQAIGRYLLLNGGYHVYLRTYDVGKLAMQVTVNYKDSFKIVLADDYLQENKEFYAWVFLTKDKQLPLEELRDVMWSIDIDRAFTLQRFKKRIKKEFKGKNILFCPDCGEATARNSMILYKDRLVCKTCAFFEKD